jgi:hypothetical protein
MLTGPAYEAALVNFYDKTCAKLPANFVRAKTKEGAGFNMNRQSLAAFAPK